MVGYRLTAGEPVCDGSHNIKSEYRSSGTPRLVKSIMIICLDLFQLVDN